MTCTILYKQLYRKIFLFSFEIINRLLWDYKINCFYSIVFLNVFSSYNTYYVLYFINIIYVFYINITYLALLITKILILIFQRSTQKQKKKHFTDWYAYLHNEFFMHLPVWNFCQWSSTDGNTEYSRALPSMHRKSELYLWC